MPNKHAQKRTIKLRQAQAISYGRDFLKVGSGKNAHAYPKFPKFTIQANPNWLKENVNWALNKIPGGAQLSDYNPIIKNVSDFFDAPLPNYSTGAISVPTFAEFMFTHTIFEGLLPNG